MPICRLRNVAPESNINAVGPACRCRRRCDVRATIDNPTLPFAPLDRLSRKSVESDESVAANGNDNIAQPGSLEHFLVERYYLYCADRRGRLFRGQVHHRPYPLCSARIDSLEQTMLSAADIRHTAAPCHACYSPGVEVDVYGLRGLDAAIRGERPRK